MREYLGEKAYVETDGIGNKRWYKNGTYHRDDGPAVVHATGFKSWWYEGKLHREDGPAVIWAGDSYQWWYHGKNIHCNSQVEFERLLRLKAFW